MEEHVFEKGDLAKVIKETTYKSLKIGDIVKYSMNTINSLIFMSLDGTQTFYLKSNSVEYYEALTHTPIPHRIEELVRKIEFETNDAYINKCLDENNIDALRGKKKDD